MIQIYGRKFGLSLMSLSLAVAIPVSAAILLQAAVATAAEPTCQETDKALPATWAGWTETASPVTAGVSREKAPTVAFGQRSAITLVKSDTVTLTHQPEQSRSPADPHSGIVTVALPAAGTYLFGLSTGLWIDVIEDGKLAKSTAHGHGPECSTIRKFVQFDLKAGAVTVQLSGNDGAKTDLLVVKADTPAADHSGH